MTLHYGARTEEDSYAGDLDVVNIIGGTIKGLKIGGKFRLLDLCCGHGKLIKGLRRAFPDATLVGLDITPSSLWGDYGTFIEEDVNKYIEREGEDYNFDIVVMLDTYRVNGWSSEINDWLRKHSRYFITDILAVDMVNIPFKYQVVGTFKAQELGGTFNLVLCFTGDNNEQTTKEP